MLTEAQVRDQLNDILVPGIKRGLGALNMVRGVNVSGSEVRVSLAETALTDSVQQWLKDKVVRAVGEAGGDSQVTVDFVAAKPAELNRIGNVVAIMSGKGGVGKSLVAGLTAIALRREGFEVGILDADITGPSIPKMFGVSERPAGSNSGILPVLSKSGIEVMSFNLLLGEEEAVIWRGPLISRAITQFWEDVVWGNLDYLVIDLPPGTSDAALTVMQTIPITGIIVVSTPQDLTNMIVKKALAMARKMDKPILGVVENMSYLYVAELHKNIELFGHSRADETARTAHAPLLGRLAIDPDLAKLCDEGHVERYDAPAFHELSRRLKEVLPGASAAGDGEA